MADHTDLSSASPVSHPSYNINCIDNTITTLLREIIGFFPNVSQMNTRYMLQNSYPQTTVHSVNYLLAGWVQVPSRNRSHFISTDTLSANLETGT